MKKNTLITFVGLNDFNKERDGAILTVFKDKKRKFEEVLLLWNPATDVNFYEIAEFVRSEIISRKYCKKVELISFECDDVTDHNEIYPKLLSLSNSLDKSSQYTAAIASGTPSMQACWILLAESGDFKIKLIRSNDPKYKKPFVSEVKLGTALPRIVRLEEENKLLKKDLLKNVLIDISRSELKIGEIKVPLAPIELCYYRYFLQRVLNKKDYLRVDVYMAPDEFSNSVLKFHREFYPEADSSRIPLEKSKGITSATFRANVSKLNKKISASIDDKAIASYYLIEGTGQRFRKMYGVNLPSEKIKIK